MRKAIIGIAAALTVSAAALTSLAQKPPAAGSAPTAKTEAKPAAKDRTREQDEQAIRSLVDAFAKSYNAHDSKAIGALFAADAELVDEEEDAVQGRANIERVFTGIFAENPDAQIAIAIKSIRFLSPTIAVEDGTATVTGTSDEPADPSRYVVIHSKQDGKWQMTSARDFSESQTPAEEHLKPLAWMIGDWVDESPDSLVVTSSRWTDNQQFILSEFTIQVGGRPLMNGTQRIGWDPLAKVIRSWVFDSEGGFAEGTYTQDGDQWIVKMSGVTRDGQVASATNITTFISKDRMTWQSRDRSVGGRATGDIDPVTVVRKPPKPM